MAIPTIEDDPCGRAIALRAERDAIILGQNAAEVDHNQGNGVRRRTVFGRSNLDAIDREIAAADNACALSKGQRPRGRVIAGSRRG